MKKVRRILSLSLGSSKRDKTLEMVFLDQQFILERRGSDGSLDKLAEWIRREDGQADIITLGGINLNLVTLTRRYPFRDARRLVRCARVTPVVDGELFRDHVEPYFVRKLVGSGMISPDQSVLFPLVSNRFGMAGALLDSGFKNITYGDLVFDLGLPFPALKSLNSVNRISSLMARVITNLPYLWFYPTGSKQEEIQARRPDLFRKADILAGDFHNIRRFLLDDMSGKVILTNTVTMADRQLLTERGLKRLITVTPNFEGRSFGTNLLSGVILCLLGKPVDEVSLEEYLEMVERLGLTPSVQDLN